jgi:hypothetical protein
MRPLLGVHPTLNRLLDTVVAYGGRGVEAVSDLGLRQRSEVASGGGMLCPYPGEAVRLQFGAYRCALRSHVAFVEGKGADLVLYMMAVFMSQHVCLRKWSSLSTKPCAQLIEEAKVNLDSAVQRAIEWPHLRGGGATAGLGVVGEERGLCQVVAVPAPCKLISPKFLNTIDETNNTAVLSGVGIASGAAGFGQACA